MVSQDCRLRCRRKAAARLSTEVGSWRTSHLAAPRDETARISKLQYLEQARSFGDLKGLTVAFSIMGVWGLLLWRGLTMCVQLPAVSATTEGPTPVMMAVASLLGHMPLMAFLFTGMFITAHGAMHGTVAPHYRKLNDAMAPLCAVFCAVRLRPAAGRTLGASSAPGYCKRSRLSSTWQQLLAVVCAFYAEVRNCEAAGWDGRGHGASNYPDEHRSRSNNMPTWLSLITCYHFGYHHEHHE